MPEPHLRAGDTDREAVAAALGTHMAAGRLTLAEYDERLAQAYAAKTYGELAELTADLPAAPPVAAPTAAGPAPAPAGSPAASRPAPTACGPRGLPLAPPIQPWAWHGRADSSWRAWLATSVIVLVVYLTVSLANRDLDYFWPMWVIGPWGAALLAHRIGGQGAPARDSRPQLDR